MRRNFLFLPFSILLLIFNASSATAYSTSELLQMTQESLRADWQNNTAYVRGVGRIADPDDSQSLFLARRAALTDARRGLLSLRKKILSSKTRKNFSSSRLSGYVPPLRLLSESMSDELYFVEVEAELSRLLGKNGTTELSKIYSLTLEEED